MSESFAFEISESSEPKANSWESCKVGKHSTWPENKDSTS